MRITRTVTDEKEGKHKIIHKKFKYCVLQLNEKITSIVGYCM